MRHTLVHRFVAILAFLGLLGFGAVSSTGCGAAPVPTQAATPIHSGTDNEGDLDPDDAGPVDEPVQDDVVDSVVLDDESFANARAVEIAQRTTKSFSGEIADPTDVDVYDIGPVAAGERLVVTVEPQDDLDSVLGLFDDSGDSLMINDDRNYYGGDVSSHVSLTVRHDSAACFVAVASSYQSGTRGQYTVTINRAGVEEVRVPARQVVYLNFDGAGPIAIGRREPVSIPAFEGSQIADAFIGDTDELIEATVAHIRADYDGLEVDFVSSRESAEPTGAHTTVHFGAYDPGLLGIADYVDEFNAAPTQKAIVYVDTFKAFLPLSPSVEEMGIVLANVASHETGHLLGLNHTSDSQDIMDIDASLRQMLANQAFMRAPLHREVFPIGYQDNARLLVEAVGGDLARLKASAAAQVQLRAKWYDEGDLTPARVINRPFSTCFCQTCAKHRDR